MQTEVLELQLILMDVKLRGQGAHHHEAQTMPLLPRTSTTSTGLGFRV